MRNAETVFAIIRKRGTQRLPLDDLYRQLFNPDLYLHAYTRLSTRTGALTAGTTPETVDGMSREKIEAIIADIRAERFRWTPARRIAIPKANGRGQRLLGIPTWRDKVVQDVMRSLLEAYYEPQFRQSAHGFRPQRGVHTALDRITTQWRGTKWFIEGDIQKYFDTIDHTILLRLLRKSIHDNRFLRLIETALKAGYMENWHFVGALSGTPQGSVISPILSNIYLDALDTFVEDTLIPEYTRGQRRMPYKPYVHLQAQLSRHRKNGNWAEVKKVWTQLQRLPANDPSDPNFRRLTYVRYADDFLLGFAGSHAEAEMIKQRIRQFLRDTLALELSDEKTLISNARTQPARFLGYDIVTQHANDKHDSRLGYRSINGHIGLRVPASVIEKARVRYMRRGKPNARGILIHEDDFSIVSTYQAEFRGIVQYYALAYNVSWFHRLRYVMETSLLRTLAAKHKTTRAKMRRKYATTVETPYGRHRCFEVRVARPNRPPLVARFGGIPLRRQKKAVIVDADPVQHVKGKRSELLTRLLAEKCEICGATERIEVHHIRKLADLNVKGQREKSVWIERMAALRRKTLVVCRHCHDTIHSGKASYPVRKKSLASRVR